MWQAQVRNSISEGGIPMSQPMAPEVVGKTQGNRWRARPAAAAMPNPGRLFQAFNAYQQTAAMKAAIELDVFTAIGGPADHG